MFKKLLARVGMGSAKVETQLSASVAAQGGAVSGVVSLVGGEVEQSINALHVVLATSYERERRDSDGDTTTYHETCDLVRAPLLGSFTLAPKQAQQLPFTLQVPPETPVTIGRQSVWVSTHLDIAGGVDSGDRDPVNVQPHPAAQAILDALQMMGFHLHSTEVAYSRQGGRYPIVQEFEFKPSGGYRSPVQEVEVSFRFEPHALGVLLEVDRRGRGLGGFLSDLADMDERWTRISVPYEATPQQAATLLDDAIQRAVR